MISTTLFPGRYVQGANSIQRIGAELSRFGQKVFAICTPFVFEKTLPNLQSDIQKIVQFNVEKFNRECSDEEIDRLSSMAEKHKAEVIAGIGYWSIGYFRLRPDEDGGIDLCGRRDYSQ